MTRLRCSPWLASKRPISRAHGSRPTPIRSMRAWHAVPRLPHAPFDLALRVARHAVRRLRVRPEGRSVSNDFFRQRMQHWIPRRVHALARHFLGADPPDHIRLRALVSKAFTPRSVNSARPIQNVCDEMLDQVAERRRLELVDGFALRLPLTIIEHMLGIRRRNGAVSKRGRSASPPGCPAPSPTCCAACRRCGNPWPISASSSRGAARIPKTTW